MTILEMIGQLKAAGYSVFRTERLDTLYSEFLIDLHDLDLRKDAEGYLEYHQKLACAQLGHMIAQELFAKLEFKQVRGPDPLAYDTYRTEVTIVKPRDDT